MAPPQQPIRVMIVDDSAVIRSVISRTLRNKEGITVVGTAFNGKMAVETVEKLDPDIIILDIEMPIMDGITALPEILKKKPGVKVLICSTLSNRGAEISVKALSLGATECILKPGGDVIVSATDFQDSLVKVVRSLAPAVLRGHAGAQKTTLSTKSAYSLRKESVRIPAKIVAIGSSTGGPSALIEVLNGLNNLPVPIVITQHMPKTFTAILAKHITDTCKIPTTEGADGMEVLPGHAYVAPGGYHMLLQKGPDQKITIKIDDGPLENYCRPSVNPMLRSIISLYGAKILCAILTGMGNDGSQACEELVQNGGQVIAQDEHTSVVWGMPGAVATAGLCSAVLPPREINQWILRAVSGAYV
jgi:two-component system chemotaxis response regulator CheB